MSVDIGSSDVDRPGNIKDKDGRGVLEIHSEQSGCVAEAAISLGAVASPT